MPSGSIARSKKLVVDRCGKCDPKKVELPPWVPESTQTKRAGVEVEVQTTCGVLLIESCFHGLKGAQKVPKGLILGAKNFFLRGRNRREGRFLEEGARYTRHKDRGNARKASASHLKVMIIKVD